MGRLLHLWRFGMNIPIAKHGPSRNMCLERDNICEQSSHHLSCFTAALAHSHHHHLLPISKIVLSWSNQSPNSQRNSNSLAGGERCCNSGSSGSRRKAGSITQRNLPINSSFLVPVVRFEVLKYHVSLNFSYSLAEHTTCLRLSWCKRAHVQKN